LAKTKYKAYEIQLMKTKRLPVDVLRVNDKLPLRRIKIQAPVVPKKIPISLLRFIFSFNKKEENKRTKMGPVVIIREALMGVVKFNPSKKRI